MSESCWLSNTYKYVMIHASSMDGLSFEWTAMKSSTDIHGAQSLNPTDSGDWLFL